MQTLVNLCRSISDQQFFNLRSSLAKQQISFGKLLWLVNRTICTTIKNTEINNSNNNGNNNNNNNEDATSDGNDVNYQDDEEENDGDLVYTLMKQFFVDSITDFIGKNGSVLMSLSVADRRLVLAIKFRLSFHVETVLPFSRVYRTVAYFTPRVDANTNDKQTLAIVVGNDDFAATPASGVGANQNNPYTPPTPDKWVKLYGCEQSDRSDGVYDILPYFRRQRIRKDLGFLQQKQQQHQQHNFQKFRTSHLPTVLRACLRRRDNTIVRAEHLKVFVDTENEEKREADEPTTNEDQVYWPTRFNELLNDFSLTWAKLRYLEPNVIPEMPL